MRTLDVEDLMQEAEGKLFEISQRNVKKDVTQINPVIKDAMEMLQKAALQKEGLSGLRTGFEGLDKMTSGWQNSDLIIIAARPAMGKTAFVLSMAKNMAVNFNTPVALFSLEMSNVQLVNRLIVNVCEIPGEKIKSGRLESYEWEQLDLRSRSFTTPRSSWTIPRACPSSSCGRKPVVWCVSMALNVSLSTTFS